MASKKSQADKLEAIEKLKRVAPAGTKFHLTLVSTARTGMSRVIKCSIIEEYQGEQSLSDLSGLVAKAVEMPEVKGGVRIGGCGCRMDMGFALIDALSYAVFGQKCQQRGCASTGGYRFGWI